MPDLPSSPDSSGRAEDGTHIGHVHLKVADLDRALGFRRDVIGLQVTHSRPGQVAFLSAGGYHHHVALNTWESLGGSLPAPGTTGLYHVALVFADRASLGAVLGRLLAADVPLEGSADHGVSEAIYLRDPDGNGVEIYRDRPWEEWPRDASGGLVMFNRPLDLRALLAEAAG